MMNRFVISFIDNGCNTTMVCTTLDGLYKSIEMLLKPPKESRMHFFVSRCYKEHSHLMGYNNRYGFKSKGETLKQYEDWSIKNDS